MAARHNHDGFGFVTKDRCFKTMDFEEFMKEYHEVPRNENVLIHFRWATHGSKKTSNCHPFRHGNVFFMHNGVLPFNPEDDITDSEFAFENFVYPAIQRYGYDNHKTEEVINSVRGSSRFATMKKGFVKLYGNFIKRDGIYFSNLNFMPYGYAV